MDWAGEDCVVSNGIIKLWQVHCVMGQVAEKCSRKSDFVWDSKEQLQLTVMFL